MDLIDFQNLFKQRRADEIGAWLSTGTDGHYLNARNSSGSTALSWACDHNESILANRMLDAGADPNVRNNDGWTPLTWAAWHGNQQLVERLIAMGATVDARTNDGLTPFLIAAQNGHNELLIVLEAAGANVHKVTSDKTTALHLVSFFGREKCLQTLAAMGLQMEARDREGNTPLMLSDNAKVVYELVDLGADIHAVNDKKWTALHRAACRLNDGVADALLWCGANIDALDEDGNTPLLLAMLHGHITVDKNFGNDHVPTYGDHLRPLVKGLLGANACLESRGCSGMTALMHSRDAVATEMLLLAGADPHGKDTNGSTALMHCFLQSITEAENIDIARKLLAHGARRTGERSRPLEHHVSLSGRAVRESGLRQVSVGRRRRRPLARS